MENYWKRGVEPSFQIQIQKQKQAEEFCADPCLIQEGFWTHQSIESSDGDNKPEFHMCNDILYICIFSPIFFPRNTGSSLE